MLLQGVQKNRESYVCLLEQTWGSPAILLPPEFPVKPLQCSGSSRPLLVVSSSIHGYLFINK